jgi:hypothetical protein
MDGHNEAVLISDQSMYQVVRYKKTCPRAWKSSPNQKNIGKAAIKKV